MLIYYSYFIIELDIIQVYNTKIYPIKFKFLFKIMLNFIGYLK